MDTDFYDRYFLPLDDLMNAGVFDRETFLAVLQSCENQIGHQKSYGERKSFVLSQAIKFVYGID
ncbi:hypothetical protein H6B07_19335, partial [Mediterraneibacter glycyrrhizinilyticus]|nr:hypothetical protein [Mediterraneibacter glycyrrhizinilyticus]